MWLPWINRKERTEDRLAEGPTGTRAQDRIAWGPMRIDQSEAVQHFLALGATGSGKTTILRLLMQSVLPQIAYLPDTRALTNDPKGENVRIIRGIAPNVRVETLDPFDDRGVAWDIAKDVSEPRIALEVAATLVPREPESQPFFADSTRHLLYAVMLSFLARELNWTLADLLRCFTSPKLLRNVLSATKYTRSVVTRYFHAKRALSHVLSTAATKLLPFEAIASCWESAERRISIRDWIDGSFVLVLPNCEINRFSIDALNRCIFKRASDLMLNQPNSDTRRSWVIIDEATDSGKLDGLVALSKKGRSKGCAIVLAMQSVAGLRDPALYGPSGAAEILGQFGHRWFGRLECEETAAYASKLIGDAEVRQITVNRTYSAENSVSHNENITIRPTVLPSELLSVPPCNIPNGLCGYYLSRSIPGVFQATLPGEMLFRRALKPIAIDIPESIPRSVAAQYPTEWSREQKQIFAPTPKRKSTPPESASRLGDDFQDL